MSPREYAIEQALNSIKEYDRYGTLAPDNLRYTKENIKDFKQLQKEELEDLRSQLAYWRGQ